MGVTVGTLRTWDRCYGVSPTDHSGGDRRYTTRDVLRVGLMRHFLSHGAVPAEAARLAQAVTTETETLSPTPGQTPGVATGTTRLHAV
jgi:DNA-binding transcriptional MerR regulator